MKNKIDGLLSPPYAADIMRTFEGKCLDHHQMHTKVCRLIVCYALLL